MQQPPSSVNFPALEEDVLARWQRDGTFQRSNDIRDAAKNFHFYDGPPFANGLPHYGHILAGTTKDVVPRYWNMRGYKVDRRFGWDCHGLPVEYEIEKTHELKGRTDIIKMGVDKFNEACRASVMTYTKEWRSTITRLGRWVDWDRPYHTMDKDYMESVWWVFKELYENDHVYRGHKIVPYSPRITAVLSNFEANQNYKDVQDPSVYIKFKLKDDDAYMLAWTTTPWTLVSNLALVVGPELTYVRVKDLESGDTLILAKELLASVFRVGKKRPAESLYTIEAELKGSELAGKSYEPLFDYFKDHEGAFKVFADDFVSVDGGTGVVHSAPAFGEDDFRICQAHGIALVDPLDESAVFTDQVPDFAGQYIKDADKPIIKAIKDSGNLFRQDTIVHSYPFCERTDQPLIYRAIPAWYVKVERQQDALVANNRNIHWVPEHIKEGRMGNWLANARDWAISRNRFWGTPLPIWVCDKDDSIRHCVGSVAELEELAGVTGIDDIHSHKIDHLTWECKECPGGTMRRIEGVFDCWFESGSMPYAQVHYPFENKEQLEASFPADFISEGLDQTRGWFYTLSVLSQLLKGREPFKNCVINGMVLAEDGRKMSKRWRNYTPPDELVEKNGADSVRLYMLNSAILRGEDLKFKDEGVKEITRAVLLPLWNAYSFLATYAHADGWQPDDALKGGAIPKVTSESDRWIISRVQTLLSGVNEEMEAYKLYAVVPKIVDFVEELTNWYIRLNRRRFWGGESGTAGTISADSRAAYSALFYSLRTFCQVLAPFAPFVSDDVYRRLVEASDDTVSVHLTDWPMADAAAKDTALERQMSLVRTVTELGRSLRAKHQLKVRQPLAGMLVITADAADREPIEQSSALICSELNLKGLTFSADEGRYVDLVVKPNLKILGRKLGKDLKKVRDELTAISGDAKKAAALIHQVEADGQVDVAGIALSRDDLLIDRLPRGDDLVATESGMTIILDGVLTPELVAEGLARELVNRVQRQRKDSGFDVSDKISLNVAIADDQDGLGAAIKAHSEYICGETLATSLADSIPANLAEVAVDHQIEKTSCRIALTVDKSR